MPFLVTTKRPGPCIVCVDPACTAKSEESSQRAVATLDEATMMAARVIRAVRDADGTREAWDAAFAPLTVAEELRDDETTRIPLPDGTVIEVTPTTYVHLACDGDWQWPQDDTDYSSPARHGADVLAAYNAKQAL
jgi:hypothetical protein